MSEVVVKRTGTWVSLAVLAVVAFATVVGWVYRDELRSESSPAQRGADLVIASGCLACHGPAGQGGVPNPVRDRAEPVEIPDLLRERHEPETLREWVRDGLSAEKASNRAWLEARERRAVRMPAYGDRLDAREIDDVVAWLALGEYAAAARRAGNPGIEGRARELGCFHCHGELGQGGVRNPGALKSIVPGFFGRDFMALTDGGDRERIREWILDGEPSGFREERVLGLKLPALFLERQSIQMPAYRGVVDARDADALVELVLDLHRLGPLDAEALIAARPIGGLSDVERPASEERGGTPEPTDATFAAAATVLERHCVRCHGARRAKNGYRLDRRDRAFRGGEIAAYTDRPAIVPGDAEASLLATFVRAKVRDGRREIYPMPPEGEPRPTPPEVRTLIEWIERGAPWPEGVEIDTPAPAR